MIAVAIAGGVAYVLQLKGYFVMPDELTYQREALYIADHFRPVPPSDVYYNSISQLGPLIQTPAWALTGDVGTALDVAHVLNVVVFATSCVPVYLLTRRITESMPASLLAGAAAVAVPWFAMAGTLMTEPVAYHGEGPVWSPRWGQDALHACALASALSLTSFAAWVAALWILQARPMTAIPLRCPNST